MSEAKDYYRTLGILPAAEDFIIQAAYRALAQRYHPDRFPGSKQEA
ncbi:MAG: molecular chaperone DnaJ, partial [Methylocystis sp.]